MIKPLIVYVSGAPGSGKTTLANLLSEQLYIPHISSDLVHGGVEYTSDSNNREETFRDIFVPTMISMAHKGVSFVVDSVLQKGLSETDIIDRLRPHAVIVYVHTQSTNPIERYISRVESSIVPSIIKRRKELLGRVPYHKDNLKKTSQPLKLGVSTIIVDTDDGYAPNLDEIISYIHTSYTSQRQD